MSPENCGVFLASKRGNFSKNSGILQLVRRVSFVRLRAGGTGPNDFRNMLMLSLRIAIEGGRWVSIDYPCEAVPSRAPYCVSHQL